MKFESKWLGLTVLTGGRPIQFKDGKYQTTDKGEIAILRKTADVVEVEEVEKGKK